MTTKNLYRLRIKGQKEREISATPQQAAREAARYAARGTLWRTKGYFDQAEDMQLPAQVSLIDDQGRTLMTCTPSVMSPGAARRGARVKYSFARCSIKPAFKNQIRRRKRKTKR